MLYANSYKDPDDYIAINPDFRAVDVSRKQVLLRGKRKSVKLPGELNVELVSLMDGSLRRDEIKDLLSATFDQALVEEAITQMIDSGYAIYAPSAHNASDTARRMLSALIANRERWSESPRIRYTADGVMRPASGRRRRRPASK